MQLHRSLPALVAVAVVALCAITTAQPKDEEIYGRFLEWAAALPGDQFPPRANEVGPRYRKVLLASGLSPEAVDEQIGLIEKRRAAGWPEWTSLVYNWIYSSKAIPFRTAPNEFMTRMTAELKPGKALDIAMGAGRNALWLAARGWDVTGYDVSDVGLEMAKNQASALGLTLHAVKSSIEQFDHGQNVWDLVVITYGPVTPAVGRAVRDGLKPGGVLVIENYYSPAGAPEGNQHALSPNAALKIFSELRIRYYEETRGTADWSPHRGGEANIVRLVAQK